MSERKLSHFCPISKKTTAIIAAAFATKPSPKE